MSTKITLFAAMALIALLCLGASAAEDIKAARQRLCGSDSDCLTVVVVEEVPVDSVIPENSQLDGEDPAIAAAIELQMQKDKARSGGKQTKRVPRSFLKIDKLKFKTDTVAELVKNMPAWFGPRPSKFVFRGKEVPIGKRLGRFNPRLNEKIIMIAATPEDDTEFVVSNIKGGGGEL
eukprot:GDKK01020282.1.p2 GENE.GDKK01020282.1~~GDKK01020282.1.p2  ORF type:complete len:196 (+),score=3.78 GDKK01020282.1:58-588(+)